MFTRMANFTSFFSFLKMVTNVPAVWCNKCILQEDHKCESEKRTTDWVLFRKELLKFTRCLSRRKRDLSRALGMYWFFQCEISLNTDNWQDQIMKTIKDIYYHDFRKSDLDEIICDYLKNKVPRFVDILIDLYC